MVAKYSFPAPFRRQPVGRRRCRPQERRDEARVEDPASGGARGPRRLGSVTGLGPSRSVQVQANGLFTHRPFRTEVLGGDAGVSGEESRDGRSNLAKKVDRRAIFGPVVSRVLPRRFPAPSPARASSFCGAQLAAKVGSGLPAVLSYPRTR